MDRSISRTQVIACDFMKKQIFLFMKSKMSNSFNLNLYLLRISEQSKLKLIVHKVNVLNYFLNHFIHQSVGSNLFCFMSKPEKSFHVKEPIEL